MIKNFSVGDLIIDCADAERACGFYESLAGGEKACAHGWPALKTGVGLTILFVETGVPYTPPVWPEEPGAQHKQMHLDFVVDDINTASENAVRLGATKPAMQYGGDSHVTLLDTEGHPFCLCRRSQVKSEFDLYFESKGIGSIPDISINIDCRKSEVLRGFYAQLTDWDQGFHWTALLADNNMVVHFMGCDGDFDYVPPVWPEAPGMQQKQMMFNFRVDDVQSAVEEALRAGATKAAEQYILGGAHLVTLIDTEGHPFCLSVIK